MIFPKLLHGGLKPNILVDPSNPPKRSKYCRIILKTDMSKLVQTGMFVPNVKKIGQSIETTYSHTPPRKYNFEKKNHLYLVLGSRYHLIVLPV